nr:hypothetical protein [Tanacetum cinerariifolium]
MVQKPVWNHAMRVNYQNSTRITHPHSNRHVIPTAVLTRSSLVPLNAAIPVTTAVPKPTVKSPKPTKYVVTKAHSPIRRPINHRPTPKNSNFHQKVTSVKAKKVNAVQGYVAFGRNSKGGKITGKGKIKTGKLDFDDVYFVKELKFNLFSVSQICDKKNNILFTDTKCVILSSDFKLPDENHVLLRVSRENNMYNVDLKNVVPLGDLTFFVNATLDESNLWHRRLCHINFKTMNKLVKDNLVRGLPSKVFKNNHTCVACKKGKQHRASWSGPKWIFDIDTLTQSMNYQPVVAGNQPNHSACIKENLNAGKVIKEVVSAQQYVLLPLWSTGSKDPQNIDADASFDVKDNENEVHVSPSSSNQDLRDKFEEYSVNSTNRVNAGGAPVTAVGPNLTNSTNSFNANCPSDNAVSLNFKIDGKSSFMDPSHYPDDLDMPALEDIVYSDDEDDVGAKADFSNLETNISVSPIPTTIEEPKRVHQALKDPSWIEAMQKELLQFKMQKFWKDERGIVIRDKARLVAQRHTQEEGIDYKEVFAPVAGIEAIWLFLAYASFIGFIVYQMDVKSAFLYETIKEEIYVCQPPGFKDLDYLDKVYKVVKAFYGLHQAPGAWHETLTNYLLENGFQKGKIDQTLFYKEAKSEDKYVAEILRKFGLTDGKSALTPIDTEKPLLKDPDGEDVDVHIYRSMIGSLMYLTSSRPDIMFVVCAFGHFYVTLKASHFHAVKRIFRHFITAGSYTLMLFGLTKDAVHLMLLVHKSRDSFICYNVGSTQVDAKNEDDDEVFAAPTPPSPTPTTTLTSPTHKPLPPLQEPISSAPQATPAPTSSPLQEQPTQPTNTFESSMNLLNTLMETCATGKGYN